MKNFFYSLLFILIFSHCATPETETATKNASIPVNYPTTKKTDQVDTYHGTEIKDDYRWLEIPKPGWANKTKSLKGI